MPSHIYIQIEQFFPGRHDVFLNFICARFPVIISTKQHPFALQAPILIEYADDITGSCDAGELERGFSAEKERFIAFLQEQAADILGKPVNRESAETVGATIQGTLWRAFFAGRQFVRVLEQRKIGLVLVSAEYSYLSRPVVLEAKARGISVMDIEHGFFIAKDYPEVYREGVHITSHYIADYVVVNNETEANILAAYARQSGVFSPPKFLPLGTPLMHAHELPKITQEEAKLALDLDPGKKVLSIFCTWVEPHDLGHIFQAHLDEDEFLDFTFQALRNFNAYDALQIVIKLHPAFKTFKEPGIIPYILDKAELFGIPVKVFVDDFDTVLAASDFLLFSQNSSALWEGIQVAKPVAYKPHRYLVDLLRTEKLKQANELVKADLMHYVLNESELHGFLLRYDRASELELLRRRLEAFMETWHIRPSPPEESSMRIVRWIEHNLPEMRLNQPKVSIIIPVYNKVEYTRQCLEALIEHTPSELYEVIIVDNGSTDGTGNFLATLEGDVKLITNAQNLGFSKACNQGAQAAAGAYLVFLNNDTVPHEHWLTELIDVADALDDVAVVGGKLLYPDGTIQHAGVVTPPDHLYRFMRGDFPPADKPRDFQIVTAACMLIRRSVFFDVGGFDDLFINGGEDVDLCLKIREYGYRVFYNPRSVLTHYESVSEGRHNHLQHNLDLLEKRYAQTVKLDREDYLKQDGFVLEERDGEPLWVYHEDLCRKTISVVIVTYNSRPYIGGCLASIQTQTNLSFEIIIIDNNSIDGTRDYLKDLQGFKVILNDENAGFSRACNQGIRAASGDYIVLLNPDTAVTHDWAWRLLLHFKPGVGAVGPVSNHAAGLQLSRHYQRAKLGEADINAIAERFYAWNKGKGMETKLLTGFCLMLKRSAIEETGLLDEDLFLGSEDLEYSLRLRLKGYRLVVATDVFIYHKAQASFATMLPEQTRRITREGQDKLYAKLETHYGKGKVPSSTELWNMDWFRPSQITKPPLTSIIILTFNQIEYTKACLASIVDHTQVPYEIILVDNGSTDGTRAFLADYAKTHGQCAVILNDENRGFAGGNNQGIEKAQGDYILLLNNDVRVTQDWLERLIAHMEPYPDIGMLGPMSNSVSGPQLVEQVPYGNDMEKMQAFAIDFAHAHAGQTQDVLRLVGYCLLLKREVVDLIGGLDENYGSGNFEDDDLCLRSAIAGFRHVIARDVFVHHFGSMTFKGNAINYNATLEKNRTLFARKWSHIVTMKEGGYEASLQRQAQIGELLHWGEQRFAEGNLTWAAKLFERIQIMDPGNTQAMNNLGVIQWQLGNVESAIDIFQHALIIDPANTDALANLSQAVTETARIDILKTDLLETLRRVQPDSLDLKMLDAACRT